MQNIRFFSSIKRFFRKLVEYRWFYTFSASATATIVGISLTFGINSCRDNHRKKTEAEESVMEAVGNISIRTEQTGLYVGILEKQNEIYQLADSIYQSGAEIPDSICVKFKSTLSQIQTTISDHGFEKIFRESYQLWQVLDQKELTDLINCSFEILNYTETLSTDLIDSMLEQIVMCNEDTPLPGTDARFFTEAMLRRPQFRFYMSLRFGKVEMLREYYLMLEKIYGRVENLCNEQGYKKVSSEVEDIFTIGDVTDRVKDSPADGQ